MKQNRAIDTDYKVTLSPEGWTGLENIARELNLSVSEMLERVGSGLLVIVDPEELEDYWDLQDAIEAEEDPENQERISWETVKTELGL